MNYINLVNEVPQLKRGQVWCTVCDRTEKIKSLRALTTGWPKCCGYAMTIDSPAERIRFEKRG